MGASLIRFESKEMELTGPQTDNRACQGYLAIVGRLSPTLPIVPISGPNDFHLSGPLKELLAGYRLLKPISFTPGYKSCWHGVGVWCVPSATRELYM
jgi:hypothetical protein